MALNETEVVADFVGVGNEPIEGVLVELELERPIRDGQFGEMYLPERRRAVSDELGQIRDFHVVSNEDEDAYPEHVGYTLTITYPDGTRTRKRVSVPDLASVSVFDLLNIEPGEPGDGDVGPAGPQGPKGDTGPKGDQGDPGPGLEYDWSGTELGVRAEGETTYTYTDLEGPTGPQGDEGPQGPQGDSLEYDWDGTQLGVRVEGDLSYQYTDLEGPQGPKGDTGDFENIWQGSWDGGPHDVNDVVEHEGTSYISLVNSNTDEPPSANWDTVAAKGVDGDGVPDGGTTGEYLRKASDTDQDVAWQAADAPTQAEFDDHSARHQSGGADAINVGGLSGELADPQPPKSHALGGGHDADTLANLNAKVSDATLDDAGDTRTPASHGNEAHSATFATETYVDDAVDNATPRTADLTVTVGSGGDYATINEALEDLSRHGGAAYTQNGYTVEISLLSGFVMAEQVLVSGIDLGWVEITSVDAEVTIDRSALTFEFFGVFPAFGGDDGASLPVVDVLFAMDETGDATGRDGFTLLRGSVAVLRAGAGVKNAGDCAARVFQAGRLSARDAIFADAKVTGASSAAVDVTGASFAELENADLTGSGAAGVRLDRSSVANCQGADASNATRTGFRVNESLLNCRNATANDCGQNGVRASDGSVVMAENLTATGCDDAGMLCESAAMLSGQGATVSGSTVGVWARRGGTIAARTTIADNCPDRGVLAQDGSTIDFRDGSADNAGTDGIKAEIGSTVNTFNATSTGATQFGAFAAQGGTINAEGLDASGAGARGIRAINGSYINAQGANGRKGGSDSAEDLEVESGSTINANGATGGLSKTANDVTADGIIFQ